MLNKFIKAFTLVEMLVALAVSSIIIIASYASYDLVATQYRKNLDIADMHTSGRAIMRIIERDIRMAGFEYRDKDAKVTYGSISSPLTIKDSGNKCCDEVTVIYDYFDEESKKVERIRIRYWAEPHTSNKGARHRLYKQKDILGQNKKILAKPKLGTKDVMADYIEDLQLVNVENTGLLYASHNGIDIFDPATKKRIGNIHSKEFQVLAFDSNGLLYAAGYGRSNINIFDPKTKKQIDTISTILPVDGLAFDSNGLLYAGYYGERGDSDISIFNPETKKKIGTIPDSKKAYELAFDSEGLLYAGSYGGSSNIRIFNPKTKKKIGTIPDSKQADALVFGSDGILYAGSYHLRNIRIFNPKTKKKIGTIPVGRRTESIAFGVADGLLYTGYDEIKIFDPKTKSRIGTIPSSGNHALAFKTRSTGVESLVVINLTLRTKNQYGKDRQFKKKDYHAGNYKLDKTDKYKRDTFSSTVLVRNLAL